MANSRDRNPGGDMSGFTKGPWIITSVGGVDSSGSIAIGAEGKAICDVWTFDVCVETKKANAHLISAAPELYEALRVVFEEENCDGFADETQHIIRKALSKARGES